MKASEINSQDTKWVFIKKGTCSRTFFYILDREFGHPLDDEEQAIDLLAGGILQQGYQCGILWGASMAVGAEAFRRIEDADKATGLAISATGHLIESFTNRTGSMECEDITKTDFNNKKSFAKFMVSGKFISCFNLSDKWAPEAIAAAKEGLSIAPAELPDKSKSCASELVRKMGGSDAEMMMVAGFAGGLGLKGSGCGALAAAIWMSTLELIRKEPKKSLTKNPKAEKMVEAFYEETDFEMACSKICGQSFKNIEDHTAFVEDGGCKKLIDRLAAFNAVS